MIKNYFKYMTYGVLLLGGAFATASAQELTREERVKILEALKAQDVKWEETTSYEAITLAGKTTTELEKIELPPLSVFLDAVMDNATVKSTQVAIDEMRNDYVLEKRKWLNWFSASGSYSYGRFNVLSNNSDEFTPVYQTTMSNAQHSFSVGANVGFSLGDILNRGKMLKKYKYQIEQLKYAREEAIEERSLRVVEAYNDVTIQLTTIRAKAESAALYNAQMKISENDFIQGKTSIIALSLERARRSGAVVTYEEARVTLHNSIMLLEMLTNVKIIRD